MSAQPPLDHVVVNRERKPLQIAVRSEDVVQPVGFDVEFVRVVVEIVARVQVEEHQVRFECGRPMAEGFQLLRCPESAHAEVEYFEPSEGPRAALLVETALQNRRQRLFLADLQRFYEGIAEQRDCR